jgi:hypothetical protein
VNAWHRIPFEHVISRTAGARILCLLTQQNARSLHWPSIAVGSDGPLFVFAHFFFTGSDTFGHAL